LQPEHTSKIRDTVLFTGAILFTTIFGLFMPLLAFFWPVPVALSVLRLGGRTTIGGIIIAALAAGLIWDNQVFLAVILVSGLVGLIIGGAITEGFSGKRILYFSVAGAVISQGLFLAANQLVLGVDYWSLVEQVMQEAAAFYGDPALPEAIPAALEAFQAIYPTIIFVSGALTAILSLIAVRLFAGRLKLELPEFPQLTRWRLDSRLSLSLFLILGLFLLSPNLIFLNLFLGIVILFCGNGFSVIGYWMEGKFNKPAKRLVLTGLFILLIFPVLGAIFMGIFVMFFLPLAMVLGLLDSWRDLRKLNRVGGG